MTNAVYVLEVNWCWDNANTEYATITIEEPDSGFEELLDSKISKERKSLLLSEIEKTAAGIDRAVMGKGNLVCLYRIKCENPDDKWVMRKDDEKTGVVTLTMRMVPVCKFNKDMDGNLIATNII